MEARANSTVGHSSSLRYDSSYTTTTPAGHNTSSVLTTASAVRRVRNVLDELSVVAQHRCRPQSSTSGGRLRNQSASVARHMAPTEARRLAAERVLEQVEAAEARATSTHPPSGPLCRHAPPLCSDVSDTDADDDSDHIHDDGSWYNNRIPSKAPQRNHNHVVEMVRQRRAMLFENTMVHRLDAFLTHDARRGSAKAAFLEASRDGRRMMWARVFAHACFTNMLTHHLILRRAYEVLKQKFLYKYLRQVRKKRSVRLRAQRLRERQAIMLAPPPKEILRAQLVIFQKLPDATIDALTAVMTKKCLFAGEFLAYEGEPGECVSILHSGTLRVSRRGAVGAADAQTPLTQQQPGLLRARGGSAVAGNLSVGKQTAQRTLSAAAMTPGSAPGTASQRGSPGAATTPQTCLTPDKVNTYGWAVGQTMLFATEPYEYTFRAAVDCDLWVLSGAQFVEIVAATMVGMPRQLEAVNRVLDERRAFNMAQLRCMSEPALRASSPLFQHFSSHGIQKILSVLRPLVVRKGDIVVSPGRYGLDIVFVVGGKVDVCAGSEKRSAILDVARVGMCVGEVAALLEKHHDSKTIVRATSTAELWVLGASDLQAVVIHEDTRAVMAAALAMVDEHGNERPLRTRTAPPQDTV